ncbi:MAG: CinA family nicotinamide mononucleotide deamidase-related protein [Gemmatimonadales bacterium]
MDVEIIAVGTELLLGFTLDTNGPALAQALAEVGVRVTRRAAVPDDPGAIAAAVAEALARTRLVIAVGGLGPTSDDCTRPAVAGLFGAPLEFQPAIWEGLQARFGRMGRPLAERNRVQAEVPRGATVIPNPRGTAPGLWVSGPPGEAILLPGVPAEFLGLVAEEVVPRLRERLAGTGERVIRSQVVRTTGIAESAVAERLASVEPELAPLTLAYLPGYEGVDLRLTAWDLEPAQADRLLVAAVDRVMAALAPGDHVYGTGPVDLAARLLEACRERLRTLAAAESSTGGLVGARITAIPGSSDVFVGGLIAYANRLKQELGVPPRILREHGAVSEETAAEMARRARERYQADLGLSVTGIAGPAGGSVEKPVGLVWFGIADQLGVTTHRWVFGGSRQEIRARAAQFALWRLWQRVRS